MTSSKKDRIYSFITVIFFIICIISCFQRAVLASADLGEKIGEASRSENEEVFSRAVTEGEHAQTDNIDAIMDLKEQDEEAIERSEPIEEIENEAVALDSVVNSGSCGENLTWKIENGTLTISGTGKMDSGSIPGSEIWPWSDEGFETVIIEPGVTSIGAEAFWSQGDLVRVDIPDSVRSIGAEAFQCCTSLANVDIPEGLVSIGESAFELCSSLMFVNIPSSVTAIGEKAFSACVGLTAINVNEDNSVFCSENGVLFNKERTRLICYPAGNENETYNIPETVTEIGRAAFEECEKLTYISVPEGVGGIENGTFSFCRNLMEISLPSDLEYIEDRAFLTCKSLLHIDIPSKVTYLGSEVFANCSSLLDIDIPINVTEIGKDAFILADHLKAINVDERNDEYCSENGVLFSKNKKILICCPEGYEDTEYAVPNGVTEIGGYAFYGCINLNKINMPQALMSIGESAFAACAELTEMTIPSNVTSIESLTFEACDKLSKITIPLSVSSIGYGAFSECNVLADVYYKGTQKNWDQIVIEPDNEALMVAVIHYGGGSERTDLSKIAKVDLNKNVYVYSGKKHQPNVSVQIGKKRLKKNSDYSVRYQNNINIGTASVVISGIGKYTGRITKTFNIIPRSTSITGKVQPKKKGFTVKWKVQKNVTGYQIQYSTNKKFDKKNTGITTVKKVSVKKSTINKLKAKKNYYVRVRTYKIVKGKTFYSQWSKYVNVKTK